MTTHYHDFIASKRIASIPTGFDVERRSLNPMLFPWQGDIVHWALRKGRAAMYEDCGLGKAQRADQRILTPDGWIQIGDAAVGMSVYGSDGMPHLITGVFPQGIRRMLRVVFSDGTSVICDHEHLWGVKSQVQIYKDRPGRVLTTQQIVEEGIEFAGGQKKHFVPLVSPLKFTDVPSCYLIDPYTMGVVIGDGSFIYGTCRVTKPDFSFSQDELPLPIGCSWSENKGADCKTFSVIGGQFSNSENPFTAELRRLGLQGKRAEFKFIPRDYLFSDVECRIAVLQGLLDTDGGTSGSCIEFSSTSKQLSDDVVFLVRSLGGTATQSCEPAHYTKAGERIQCLDKHRSVIKLPSWIQPFRLERKRKRHSPIQRKEPLKSIVSIDDAGEAEAICIRVDSADSLYVTEGMTLTHNTPQQLVWAEQVYFHTGKPVLILAPILVGWQTLEESQKFGIMAPTAVVADQQDVIACGGICIANYEKLHKFDASCFSGVVLDESQILRSFMGKTKQALCEAFRQTPYKLCCSATPAPNDLLELGNQADFLGIMPSREMIARWFINDTMHAGNYRLMKHAVQDFWRWVSSWAVCLGSPADLGHSDEGFVLPGFNTHEHIVRGTSWLVAEKEDGVSATSIHGEKRKTLHDRCEAVAALVNDSPDQWAIWCGTDYEADELIKQTCRGEKDWHKSGIVEVRGPNSDFWKETALKAFKSGEARCLIIKPKIAAFGVNWQHCHKTTWFASYSFADYYQAMRRLYRFGQLSPVDAHLIASENELNLLDAVKRKSESHEFMKCEVAACVKEFQQAEIYGRKLQEYVPTERMRLPEWLKSKS